MKEETLDYVAFVYKRGNDYDVVKLSQPECETVCENLTEDGWKHIQTVDCALYLQSLLNKLGELNDYIGKP